MFEELLKLASDLAPVAEAVTNLDRVLSAPPKPSWKPSVSVIVPEHRGIWSPGMATHGLNGTLASFQVDVANSGLDWDFTVVSNGNPQSGPERDSLNLFADRLHATGHGQFIDIVEKLSPPAARNRGVSETHSEIILFCDGHIRLYPGFFANILQTLEWTNCSAVFSRMIGLKDNIPAYHHELTLEEDFWGKNSPQIHSPLPYRIASGNHGCFAIRRKDFEEVGGYWEGLVGWGAEESELNFKLGLMDKQLYLDPRASHWHCFFDTPIYKRSHYNAIFNFVSVANVIGGKRWAERVAKHQESELVKYAREQEARGRRFNLTVAEIPQAIENLLSSAIEKSEAQAEWMTAHRKRTFDEQLDIWKREKVPM